MFSAIPSLIGTLATASLLCFLFAGILILCSMHLLDASFVTARRSNWLLYGGTLVFVVGGILSFVLTCYLVVAWFAPIG